jgi:outer membrane protein OmpA-like peptidoglycan-associated protein
VLLAFAIMAALLFLMARRGAHRQAQAPQVRTMQTQEFARASRPIALHAGSMGALTQAMSGGTTLPRRFVLSDLTFRTDSSEIDPSSGRVLDEVAQAMAAHPNSRIRVEGHTDNTGASEANKALSQARADAARTYLIGKGIDGGRIVAAGQGMDQPLTTNDTAEGRAENRRTEIVVVQ